MSGPPDHGDETRLGESAEPGSEEAAEQQLPAPGPATYAARRRAAQAAGNEPGESAEAAAPGDDEAAADAESEGDANSDVVADAESEGDAERDLAADVESEGDAEKEVAAETQALPAGDDAQAEPADGNAEPSPGPTPLDRDQAAAAAMAALRARAGGGDGPTAPAPPRAEEPVVDQPTVVAEPPPAAAGGPAPGAQPGEKPPRATPIWPRFLAASLVIVISMATATAVSALVFLADFAEGLGGIPGVSGQLSAVEGGDPQTILILGSDKRPTDVTGRSDTTMLLRVDPEREAIALLSIPRDLKVNIKGHGVDKFNVAYAIGGPRKTLATARALTGLDIHHVVNINFTGFADAVNAIDCVYIDVDRQYYVPEGSPYAAIDPPINAGYQRLCGLKALQYVRYRHADSDLVRAARQQDFLREARQKIEPAKLAFNAGYRNKLLDIFKKYTTSDEKLEDPIEVLELMKTFIAARNAVVREVHFPAQLGGPNAPYVTASEEAIKSAVRQFLGVSGTPGARPGGDGSGSEDGRGKGGKGGKGGGKPKPAPEPAMIDVTGTAEQYAVGLEQTLTKSGRPMLDIPVLYPTLLAPGSQLSDYSRAFKIDGPGREEYRGYKLVVALTGRNAFTEYYGVSGTSWPDPPILENPSETRVIDGREYLLFYDGDRLRLVGWKTRNASYWVINTLTQTLNEAEMLAIAKSIRKLGD